MRTAWPENGGFAEKIPENMMLSSSCERVLLPEDGRGIPVELTATLDTGDRDVSSSKIWWSVTGDTDSVSLDTTQSFSGEKTQVMTALKPGTVTVTATSDSDLNVKASCEITITNEGVESIALEPEKMTLKKGESRKIKAVISPEEASGAAVLWSSSDPHIANVDKDGNVTAISGGTAVITAKAGSAEAQCEVTVKGSEAVNPGGGSRHEIGRECRNVGYTESGSLRDDMSGMCSSGDRRDALQKTGALIIIKAQISMLNLSVLFNLEKIKRSYHLKDSFYSSCCNGGSCGARLLMLRRLTPSVERLWNVAEAAGESIPATPRAISAPLKPMTKR